MKEVLIYGALVAAVLGVSTTLIQNMDSQFQTASTEIQNGVQTSVTQLTDIVKNSTGSGSGSGN